MADAASGSKTGGERTYVSSSALQSSNPIGQYFRLCNPTLMYRINTAKFSRRIIFAVFAVFADSSRCHARLGTTIVRHPG